MICPSIISIRIFGFTSSSDIINSLDELNSVIEKKTMTELMRKIRIMELTTSFCLYFACFWNLFTLIPLIVWGVLSGSVWVFPFGWILYWIPSIIYLVLEQLSTKKRNAMISHYNAKNQDSGICLELREETRQIQIRLNVDNASRSTIIVHKYSFKEKSVTEDQIIIASFYKFDEFQFPRALTDFKTELSEALKSFSEIYNSKPLYVKFDQMTAISIKVTKVISFLAVIFAPLVKVLLGPKVAYAMAIPSFCTIFIIFFKIVAFKYFILDPRIHERKNFISSFNQKYEDTGIHLVWNDNYNKDKKQKPNAPKISGFDVMIDIQKRREYCNSIGINFDELLHQSLFFHYHDYHHYVPRTRNFDIYIGTHKDFQ